MNTMDFFHCNNCFSQPGPPKNLRFFLTNCGHSFCNTCVSNTNVPQCRVCKSSCKVISLSHDLPDDVKLYFGDMIKEMKNVLKIFVIQNKHCKIYMDEYATKLEASYSEAQKELAKIKTELIELKKHYQELMVENQVLKKSSQLNQTRNKSPLGLPNFNEIGGKGYTLGRGSAFMTPSPSSASGFSGTGTRMGQGRNFYSTPEAIRRLSPAQKSSLLKPCGSLNSPRTMNSQPFVLSSQPILPPYGQSRTESTPRSWSSGSGSSSRSTTKTLRKSGTSYLSKLNKSSIF